MNDPEVTVFSSRDGSFAVHVLAYDEKVVVAVHGEGIKSIVGELPLDDFMVLAHQMGRAANIISSRVME